MKVIDLINKKYCNEEMPNTIVVNCLQYKYDDERKTYVDCLDNKMTIDFTNNVLNMEVEIIEENKTIEELENWFVDERRETREFDIQAINLCFSKHRDKINELVKEINKMKEEK